jgi:hypothetical protein
MIRKRLRMVLDFEVEVEELTEEGLHAHYRRFKSYEEIVEDADRWSDICRQVRLQRALLRNEQVLKRYLTYVATTEVDGSERSELAEVFGVDGEEPEAEIFSPLFSRLSEEDAQYYRRESAKQRFYEAIEELSTSGRMRWVGAILEEVQPIAVGKTEKPMPVVEGEAGDAESDKNLM